MVTMVKKIITMEPAHYQFVIEIYNESRHVSNTMAANVTEKIYKKKKKSKNQKDLKKNEKNVFMKLWRKLQERLL